MSTQSEPQSSSDALKYTQERQQELKENIEEVLKEIDEAYDGAKAESRSNTKVRRVICVLRGSMLVTR